MDVWMRDKTAKLAGGAPARRIRLKSPQKDVPVSKEWGGPRSMDFVQCADFARQVKRTPRQAELHEWRTHWQKALPSLRLIPRPLFRQTLDPSQPPNLEQAKGKSSGGRKAPARQARSWTLPATHLSPRKSASVSRNWTMPSQADLAAKAQVEAGKGWPHRVRPRARRGICQIGSQLPQRFVSPIDGVTAIATASDRRLREPPPEGSL